MYYTRLSQIALPTSAGNWFELVLYGLALLLLAVKIYHFVRDQDKSKYYNYYLGMPPSAKPGGLGAAILFSILAIMVTLTTLEGWSVPVVLLVGYVLKITMLVLLVDVLMFAGTFLVKTVKDGFNLG
jgi:hypothetical protein